MSAWRRVVSEVHRRSLWQVLGIYLMGSWIGFQVVLGLVEGVGLPAWLPGFATALFVIGLPIVLATAFVQEGLPGSDARAADANAPASLDPALFPSSHTHSATPGPEGAHLEAAYADSATGADAVAGADRAQRSAAPKRRLSTVLTWRRAIAAGTTAFAVLGIVTAGWLVLRTMGVGPMASLLAAEELAENDRILIAEFDPRGADSALAAVVTDAFRIDFARSTLMRTVTPAEVQDALQRMGRTDTPRLDADLAREIATRDGISAYVTGEVTSAGASFLVTARLIATSSGELLVALREKANDENDLIAAVDRMSTTLRERTGESLRTIRRAEPLAQVTTPSMAALQAYTQALRASSWEGNPDRALELHQEAVRLDTSFAAAHRAMAVHWYNRGFADRSIEAAERALRFSDRMTEVERASALSTLHLARAEFADAAVALERMVSLEPTSFATLNNLGLVYSAMQDFDRAEQYLRRSVAADTSRFFAYTNLGEHLVRRGRYEEAEQAFQDAALRAPQSAWPTVALAQLPYFEGDIVESETRLRRLLQDPASTVQMQQRAGATLYVLHRIKGEFDAAERFARTMLNAAGGDAEFEVYLVIDRIFADVFLNDRPEAVRRHIPDLRAAVAQPGADDTVLDAAFGCAWAGDIDCAREYLSRAGPTAELQPWSGLAARSAHAGVARAEGDLPRALTILQGLRTAFCSACEMPLIGLIHIEMNQPDSAAAAFERYIDTQSMERLWNDMSLAPMHEWLGRHYDDKGDMQSATRHYARMIELWRTADAEFQPRVRAAQQRLERLQPDR